MSIDTVKRETRDYKLVRREYSKNDIVWFVVDKVRKKSLVFRKMKVANHVFNKMDEWKREGKL